jgi:DNA primase
MRYPQTFIDDLKRQADIVRVIQDYVQLKKKGANWMACCPFHKEKTPSFSVSPTKEIFYCFGCHKGGSVFNFVMEMERVSFPEAIKMVADKTGMPLPKLIDDSRFEARKAESDQVIELNKWALEWWEQQLESSAEGKIARGYLKHREITDETRQTFRLAYAPDSWDALSIHLRQKGATQEQIDKSGLVVKKEEGGSYDRFRGRLIFPVMDIQGRPIAFGGRTLKDEDAKYINSPETAAYVKGRNLFGLNLTRDEIRRQRFAILVEGFLDLVVPYQFGIRNVVASLGTALTADQVKLLGRFARKVVVNYDGDPAGVQAAKKAIEILLAEDLEVKVLVLPDDADPDEFIRKFGLTEYQRQRGEAQPHIQFVIDQAVRNRNLANPADKDAALEEVLPYVYEVKSSMQQHEYFVLVMDRFKVPPGERRRYSQRIRGQSGQRVTRSLATRPQTKLTPAETRLVSLLLNDEELRRGILPLLESEDYEGLATEPVFRVLFQLENEGIPVDFYSVKERIEGLNPSIDLPLLFFSDSLHAEEEEFTAEKCVVSFRLMRINRRIDELNASLANAERAKDAGEVARLSMEHVELSKRRSELLPKAEAMQIGY